MNQETLLQSLLQSLLIEVRELKAMVAQLGPVTVTPTIEEEIAAVQAQGGDLIAHFKKKGKEEVKKSRKRRRA